MIEIINQTKTFKTIVTNRLIRKLIQLCSLLDLSLKGFQRLPHRNKKQHAYYSEDLKFTHF